MNRRQVIIAIPAVLLAQRFAFACQATEPTLGPSKMFDVVVTFDNTYPLDAKDLTYSEGEKARVIEAVRRWKAVWATEEFETQLVHHKLDRTQNKTNAQVYEAIMAASPKHANYALTDIANGSETAVTSGSITRIQRSWLAGSGGQMINRLVNTVAHEYTHTNEGGEFTHPWLQRLVGKNCVPIVVGNITEAIADKMFPAGF